MIAKSRMLLDFAGFGTEQAEAMIAAVLAMAEDGPLPTLHLLDQVRRSARYQAMPAGPSM
jgi:hypothetical protein